MYNPTRARVDVLEGLERSLNPTSCPGRGADWSLEIYLLGSNMEPAKVPSKDWVSGAGFRVYGLLVLLKAGYVGLRMIVRRRVSPTKVVPN